MQIYKAFFRRTAFKIRTCLITFINNVLAVYFSSDIVGQTKKGVENPQRVKNPESDTVSALKSLFAAEIQLKKC